MKRFFTVFIVVFSAFFSQAQNLVLNPSFENTTSNCGNPIGESFSEIINWDQANVPGADSCSTADFFSACNINLLGMGGPTSMPNSQLGYQYSRTGTRHIGLITHEAGSGWREYAQGRTSTPLVAGQSYCVSMYVSLANACLYATNNIGIYFSPTHFQRNACPGTTNSLINVTPQLNYNCSPLTDTAKWVRLQWNYVASGGENYFVIGNFFDNANTNIANVPASGGGGLTLPIPMTYYYIDDVSIVANNCCYADILPQATLCSNAAPVNLVAVPGLETSCTPVVLNGTWSGNGITNATTGEFTPSSAGPGVHTISYTLPCGSVMTTQVIVSPCVPLSVCQNATGLVVSNGVAPYSWQQQVTTQDCSACFPGVPPFIQPCSIPAGCAVSVTSWSTFTSGTSIPTPTTFPIQVMDAAGTVFSIPNLASLPTCVACPTITLTNPSRTNVSCFNGTNGSATVSASGGTGTYTYTWQPGNLTGASQTALASGTYTVTATDANSCTGTITVTITQPTALVLQTSSLPADCGQSNGSATVTVSGGVTSYSYAWSPSGGNAAIAPNLSAANYSVTVTDGNNCTATASVVVANTGAPIVSIVNQQNVTCAGGDNGSVEISIAQGAAPYTIAWSPSGGSALTAGNLLAGVYTATVTDDGGCVVTQLVTITEPTAMALTLTSQPANCGFTDGSASVVVQGGIQPYTYSWSPSGGNAATATALGGGNYTVTITDGTNCNQTGSVQVDVVSVDSTLNITTQSTPESCVGNDGTATVEVTGGTPPYSYLWSDGAINDSSFVFGLAAGGYTITVSDECYSVTEDVTIDKAFTSSSKDLPNIITPNKDNVNDFLTVGTQFESVDDFYCIIYNRWGVPVHKTDNKSIMWVPKNITDGTYFIVLTFKDCAGKDEKLASTVTVAGSKN